eukprot:754678-Hanusia_phi.AAC.2
MKAREENLQKSEEVETLEPSKKSKHMEMTFKQREAVKLKRQADDSHSTPNKKPKGNPLLAKVFA